MSRNASAERLKRRLARIPQNVRGEVEAQLRANAQKLAARQAQAAPKEEGDLADSVRWYDNTRTRLSVSVAAGGPKTTKPVRETSKGNAPVYDYALAQEFGTADMPANPFFYPVYRLLRSTMRAAVTRAMKRGIEKVQR